MSERAAALCLSNPICCTHPPRNRSCTARTSVRTNVCHSAYLASSSPSLTSSLQHRSVRADGPLLLPPLLTFVPPFFAYSYLFHDHNHRFRERLACFPMETPQPSPGSLPACRSKLPGNIVLDCHSQLTVFFSYCLGMDKGNLNHLRSYCGYPSICGDRLGLTRKRETRF
jgi:hypothetical protein